jgi:hypothetical protein
MEPPMRLPILALACALLATPAKACPFGPVAPHLEKLTELGVAYETVEGDAVPRAVTLLRERIDFDERPTRLIVVFGAHRAAIWVVVEDQLCNELRGPAEEVRAILRAARGEAV